MPPSRIVADTANLSSRCGRPARTCGITDKAVIFSPRVHAVTRRAAFDVRLFQARSYWSRSPTDLQGSGRQSGRQNELEGRAFIRILHRPNPAAMILDD